MDFVCLEKRVVIEVDGGQHAQQVEVDAERDRWLQTEGFVVLRFWNDDVLKNIEGVKEVVYKTLQNTPYLNPSRKGEGGKEGWRRKSSFDLL